MARGRTRNPWAGVYQCSRAVPGNGGEVGFGAREGHYHMRLRMSVQVSVKTYE